MPILCVWQKDAQEQVALKDDVLTASLCPYEGPIARYRLKNTSIFASSLAGALRTDEILIPHDTTKPSNSAWLSVTTRADGGLDFQTDPLGTFPLWIYEDEEILLVTSEVKSLRALGIKIELKSTLNREGEKLPSDFSPYEGIRRLPPGAHLSVHNSRARIETRNVLNYEPSDIISDAEEAKRVLADSLRLSASEFQPRSDSWGAFLSGGIDSSMATALMQRENPYIYTFTLGTEFGNEYRDAGDLAATLNIRQDQLLVEAADAKKHFERAVYCNEAWDGLTVETLAQLSFLGSQAVGKAKRIVTGYGSDLLFGGMLSHELYMKVTGVRGLQDLIERTCWTGEFSPFYAWSMGLRVHHLFWHPVVMNQAFRILPALNVEGPKDKMILRNLAWQQGYMQEPQAFRKKQALTDGTQFNRLLSQTLGLPSNYSYAEKGSEAIRILKDLMHAL